MTGVIEAASGVAGGAWSFKGVSDGAGSVKGVTGGAICNLLLCRLKHPWLFHTLSKCSSLSPTKTRV